MGSLLNLATNIEGGLLQGIENRIMQKEKDEMTWTSDDFSWKATPEGEKEKTYNYNIWVVLLDAMNDRTDELRDWLKTSSGSEHKQGKGDSESGGKGGGEVPPSNQAS